METFGMLINCKKIALSDWNQIGSCLYACQTKISNDLGHCYNVTHYIPEFNAWVYPGCHPNELSHGRSPNRHFNTHTPKTREQRMSPNSQAPIEPVSFLSLQKHYNVINRSGKSGKCSVPNWTFYSICFLSASVSYQPSSFPKTE